MDCSPPSSLIHGFPRQEYWSGLPFPPLGDHLDPGIKPGSLAWQADSLPQASREARRSFHITRGRAGCSEDTAAVPLLTAPQGPQTSDRVGGGPQGRARDSRLPSPPEQDGSCSRLLSPQEAFTRRGQSTAAFCAWTGCSGTPSGSREN